MIDRIVAAAVATPAVFYAMAASVAWCRVIFLKPSRSLGDRVTLDRAVAWSAWSVMLWTIVVVQLGIWAWNDARVGAIMALTSVLIFLAGLNSVRIFTIGRAFGKWVLAVFAVVSIAVGLLILLA